MNYRERLQELYNKQNEKNKLNKGETQEVFAHLMKYIEEEKDAGQLYDYLMTFSPDAGISAFVKCLEKLDEGDRGTELSGFLNSKLFEENKSNMSTKRGMALVALLYKGEFSKDEVKDTLIQVCRVIMGTTKSGINSQIIENVYREFIEPVGVDFFKEYVINEGVKEKDFYNIEQIFFNVAFQNINNKVKLSSKKQLAILHWLNFFKNPSTIDDANINRMVKEISMWIPEFKEAILEDESIMNRYKIKVKDLLSDEKEGQVTIKNKELNESIYNQKKILQKTSHTDPKPEGNQQHKDKKHAAEEYVSNCKEISFIYESLDSVKNKIKSLDQELQTTKANSKYHQWQYDNFKNENTKLNDTITNLKKEVEKEKNKSIALENEVIELKKALEIKSKIEEEYKDKVKILHETNNMIDNNSLQEFKNKLAGKLKNVYEDFMEVRQEVIDEEMGEILKLKVDDIFKELNKQGIKLS